ncbi:MAG: peptide ABC transporter ATP-binding protein, partial [Synergistaceae bacterium]|nr:peptide ABC transporter ATP-binding protein [Synergistaceae bacterium]
SKRIILKGELTSPIDPPDSCRFAPRCNYARNICLETPPKLLEISDNHFVACHLARDLGDI